MTFHDTLIAGENMEITDSYTLQRSPGFTKFCSEPLDDDEVGLGFYSFRNLNGTVFPLLDTTKHLYTFTSNSLTALFAKSVASQGFIQDIGSTIYYTNGSDLKKWGGSTA